MTGESGFDAVVVGAGAGGAATAWRMTQRGWRVLLLDAGPAFDPDQDYRLDHSDWERKRFPHKPGSLGQHSFAPLQALEPAHDGLRSWCRVRGLFNRGDRREVSGAGYHHVRGVGGSTLHFVGEAHRMNPHSMRMKSRFGVAADWPLDYAALEPYYVEVERLLGSSGPTDGGDRWRSAPYPLPPHALCKASRALGEGAQRLGLRWEANPRSALSRPYDGRPSCNYCGGCTRGCPRRDKGSADVTFVAKARASGLCEVRADTAVQRIVVGPAQRIVAVETVDARGRRQRVATPRLVLACGAIETPRLLLAMRDAKRPRGLANGSGQVGRNLMESVVWTSVALAPAQLSSFGGLPADAICWDHNRPDALPGLVGGFRIGSAIHESDMVGPIAYAQRALPGWGRAHKLQMRQAMGHAVAVGATGESLPNADTFVDLDPQRRDAQGLPLARIHSFVDDMTVRRLSAMADACRRLLEASGASELVEEYGTWDYFSAAHVFGTCRMGHDPRDSVVDARLRAHGFSNLYVCDASVFPSSGGGEAPSLTIQALALRAVDAMAQPLSA